MSLSAGMAKRGLIVMAAFAVLCGVLTFIWFSDSAQFLPLPQLSLKGILSSLISSIHFLFPLTYFGLLHGLVKKNTQP